MFLALIGARRRGPPIYRGPMSDLEFRPVPDSDIDQAIGITDFVFHDHTPKEGEERDRLEWWFKGAERIGAYEGDRLVAQVLVLPIPISVPGADLPSANVTGVGVLPTHRRRGILTTLMDRCLADQVAAGRPVAALWASEAAIYGRYGFGSAAPRYEAEIRTVTPLRLRVEADPRPLRLIGLDHAEEILDPLYERSRRRRAGQLARTPDWWRRNNLREKSDETGRTAPRIVVHDEGYAIFRTSHRDDEGGTVHLEELVADSPQVEAALWHFLASIDLTSKIQCWSRPLDDTLLAICGDLDQVRLEQSMALWLQITDVPAALAARDWAGRPDLVLEIQDDRLPANHGRWRLTGEGTDAAPDLTLQVRDLAAVYLGGGIPVRTLVRTGVAAEHTEGAATALDAALATPYGPQLTDHF